MTKTELEEALALIGWRIHKSSNGLNNYIVNHLGETTSFVVGDTDLEIRTNLFGRKTSLGRGNIIFKLEAIKINIDTHKDCGKIEWISLNFGDCGFIQFLNHAPDDYCKCEYEDQECAHMSHSDIKMCQNCKKEIL